jgi:hypothetical protein
MISSNFVWFFMLQDSLTYLENVASHFWNLYGERAADSGIEKFCSACKSLASTRYNQLVRYKILDIRHDLVWREQCCLLSREKADCSFLPLLTSVLLVAFYGVK